MGKITKPTGQHKSSSKSTPSGGGHKHSTQFNGGRLISPTNMGTKYVPLYYGENRDSMAPFQMSSVSGPSTQTFEEDDVFTGYIDHNDSKKNYQSSILTSNGIR